MDTQQSLGARTTRGMKRSAVAVVGGQENATPNSAPSRATKALADAAAAIKPATRFGFRAPAPAPVAAAPAPVATVPTPVQQSKRRKTNDEVAQAPIPSMTSPVRTAAPAQATLLATPSVVASAAAAVIPSVATAAPAELISGLFHAELMDDVLAGECRTALAGKVTASKFDYKERIGQLEAQMKVLRKVVSTLTKKADGFLEQAVRIEAGLHEEVAAAKNRARDLAIERATLADKAQRALQLVKQLQAQRDSLMADSKATAAQVAQHAAVMDAAQQLQTDTDAKLSQCTKDLQETMAALDQCTLERNQSKELIVDMQNQLDTAAEQMHALEQDKAALQITCDEQAQSIEERDAQIAQIEASMSSTREQYVALMEQWSTLQKTHEKTEAHVATLDKTIAGLRAELETSQQALLTAQAELAASQVQSADARSKAATELTSMRAGLNGEMSTLRRQMDEAVARNAEESAMLKAQIEQLTAAKTSLQESAQRAAVEMTSLRGQLMTSAERVGSLEVEGRRLDGELSLVRLQLTQKSDEVFATVASFERIQKFHEERAAILQNEKDALEKARAEFVAKHAQLESEKRSVQTNLEQTSASLTERTSELTALRAEHATLLSKSTEERARWEATQAELQASLATLTSTTTAQIASLEAQVVALTARGDSESARATQLGRELASFKALSGVSSESQMENLVKLSLEAETLRSAVQDKGKLAQELLDTKAALAAMQRKMAESEATRRSLHNAIQELKGNIRVFTRVRPMFHAGAKADVNTGEAHAASSEDAVSAIDVSSDGRKVRLDLGQGGAKQNYAFDACFGPATTQQQLFEEVSPLIQSALDGYHVCLFSYGQTGSGKTWSMVGSGMGDQRGIIPRSVEKVLEQAAELGRGGWDYQLEASFLEIYNESIRDLLDAKDTDLDIKRDPSGRTLIPGLTRVPIGCIQDVSTLMTKAAKNRSTAATNMNERSSRSHSVFTLYLTGANPNAKQTLAGSLNLCDLAGSERLSRSGASGDRLKETQSINKSLSALSDVFLALSQKSSHVPYRNSKLTFLLQPCLSGDGKTAMIINLNPALSSASESQCTLRFAAQVSQVELGGKPKRSLKPASDDAMDTSSSAPAAAAAAAPASAPRQSLSGLMRPTTASSATKKLVTSNIGRPSTGTAMRR